MWEEHLPLSCVVCKKDLLKAVEEGQEGAVVRVYLGGGAVGTEVEQRSPETIEGFYWACDGDHERSCEQGLAAKGFVTQYDYLTDWLNPGLFLLRLFSMLSRVNHQELHLTPQALEQLDCLLRALAPHVLRHMTPAEQERFQEIGSLRP